MAISRGIKPACLLLCKRDWREFMIRLRISMGHVDLRHDPTETDTERTHYYADSGGLEFDKLIAGFQITAEDAIVDFGCGKGGVLISLSKFPFAKIVGVEIDPARATARSIVEALMERGLLSKETHETVVRLAPPLVITREELDASLDTIEEVLA